VIVTAYLGIGNNDQAIAWLESAYAQHSNSVTGLEVYDLLRGDPRFQNLLRRLSNSNFNRSTGSWLGPARDFQTRNERGWRLGASVVQILLAVVAAYWACK
jgi:hypothetical protein